MMDYFDILRFRKYTRKFTDEQISQDNLTKLLYAANAAPLVISSLTGNRTCNRASSIPTSLALRCPCTLRQPLLVCEHIGEVEL